MVQLHGKALVLELLSDTEIKLTRVFNAPRDLVFEALSKPEHIKRWWGGHRHTMTVCEIDFRPGGSWRFVLSEAGGNVHPFKGEYVEIVPPERIVQTFIYDVAPFNEGSSLETLTLKEDNGRTTLAVVAKYDSKETRDGVIASGMEEGAAESYDALAGLLAELA